MERARLTCILSYRPLFLVLFYTARLVMLRQSIIPLHFPAWIGPLQTAVAVSRARSPSREPAVVPVPAGLMNGLDFGRGTLKDALGVC